MTTPSSESSADRYIHGYGPSEAIRLRAQAALMAPSVIDPLPLSSCTSLLEIGCGTGAELELIHERFPAVTLTGVERDIRQLRAAMSLLGSRAALVQGDAYALPFASDTFDAVATIWVMEHLSRPLACMRECLRVLVPSGQLICTEVDNASMHFSEALPGIDRWWRQLCRRQQADGGDPYVGRRLEELASNLGGRDITIEDVNPVASALDPASRPAFVAYLETLMLSAAPRMLARGDASPADLAALRQDFDLVREDPSIDFEYHGMRLVCRAPD